MIICHPPPWWFSSKRTCAVSLWCGNTLKAPRAWHPCADVLFLPHYPSVLQRSPDSAGHSRQDITHPPPPLWACVCVFQCVSYPCLSLEPFQKWLCHPASQISRRKCNVFLPERSRPLLFLVQASKQVTAAQVVHLLRFAYMFTFLDVVSLASGLYRLSPCQSPGAASVPSPGIKKQLKRLMHSSKDEQPAVNVLIFNTWLIQKTSAIEMEGRESGAYGSHICFVHLGSDMVS